MRILEIISEETLGTEPKRSARQGSRPARGHETQARYKTASPSKDDEVKEAGFPTPVMPSHPLNPLNPLSPTYVAKNRDNLDMDKVTARAKAMFAKGMTEEQVKAELVKQGVAERLANQAVQMGQLEENGPASRKLCLSNTSDDDLGASQLASCKSQGLRARDGKKSHLIGHGKSKVRIVVGGKKIKGKEHGGPLPDYGTRKNQR